MSQIALIAGRYQVREELARGGMGVVYSVLDTSKRRPAALKRLLAGTAASTHVTKLFEREFHTLVQLQHPRIIEVYDYGVDDEGPYYTMELLDGQDLRERAPLGFRDACQHLRDVASSLALLHARRLVHRDLSARNVRLTSDGRAKLLDFGALATFGVSGHVVGTPPIVPPEALSGHPLDSRADLYALGALAYWLLTGRHAYPAQNLQSLPAVWRNGTPVPPSAIAQDVPRELDQLALSLLSLDAMSRPHSAAEVIERLNVIAGLESEEVLDAGHSYLSNPKLVGRDRELDKLRRSIERKRKHGFSVVIEGEPGIGKTRLLAETALEAQLGGAVVLRVDAEIQRGVYGAARGFAAALLMALPDVALEKLSPYAATLASTIPEVAERFPDAGRAQPGPDRSERRVRVQAALADWFLAVAEQRPLLLVIDNAQAADEGSLALCAALPRRAEKLRLGVVLTQRTGEDVLAERTLSAIRDASTIISLAGLSSDEVIALVRALFGDVDNGGRVGRWLRDRTDGNPMQCFTLATQLIADGHIRYMDGAWVLPPELSLEGIPSGMSAVLERRVAQLGEGARRLAEAISIERGTLTIEQCSMLAGARDSETFSWLDELVAKGMLVGVGGDYRFSQTALQQHLERTLPEERRKELHRRAGEYLLTKSERDPSLRSDAGWHLLRGGEESRGADILTEVGSELVFSIEGTALAAPGLEAALKVFEAQGRSKWILLNVLEALTSAGWYVDRKYAIRYGRRTFDLGMELTGLGLASKLAPFIGRKLAVKIGPLVAAFRHGRVKKNIEVERFKDFKKVFGPVIASMSILVGVSANSFDRETARRILDAARIMTAFPDDHVVRVMHEYCRYLTYVTEGRISEGKPIGLRVLEWFRGEGALQILGVDGARALSGGQMTSLGMYTALCGSDEALEWAQRLDDIGLSFYRLMGTQTRFVFHVMRGEVMKATPYREELELNAIQGGTTWQTSILIPLIVGAACVASGEVARLRQSAEELESMTADIPSLGAPAKLLRAAYHFLRGRPIEALPMLDELAALCAPEEHVLWQYVASLRIRTLLALGRTAEALASSEEVFARGTEGERDSGVLTADLECAVALARAESGDTGEAIRFLDGLIARHSPGRVPLVLAIFHETRAVVARKAGDGVGAAEHIAKMAEWARATKNTALIARCKALETEMGSESRRMAGPADRARVNAVVSAMRTILEQHEGRERARAALRLLLENSDAKRGYLYLGTPPLLRRVAQVPEDATPPVSIVSYVELLASTLHRSAEDTRDTTVMSDTGPATDVMHDGEEMWRAGFAVQLLVAARPGQSRVVGAVAFEMEAGSRGHVPDELLEAVALSLENVGGVGDEGSTSLSV